MMEWPPTAATLSADHEQQPEVGTTHPNRVMLSVRRSAVGLLTFARLRTSPLSYVRSEGEMKSREHFIDLVVLSTLTLCVCSFATIDSANADTITAQLDIIYPLLADPLGGDVTFTLNPDGTIGASLTSFDGAIIGFGFNSTTPNLPESNFSPVDPLGDGGNYDGWSSGGNSWNSGFACNNCGTSETWTIGNPGDYSSVLQVLGGTAPFDFYMLTSNNQWVGNGAPCRKRHSRPPCRFLLAA